MSLIEMSVLEISFSQAEIPAISTYYFLAIDMLPDLESSRRCSIQTQYGVRLQKFTVAEK
jgi:hypothetical protein